MQIRRLWHYILGITCAVVFNSLLIFLLIVSSPRQDAAIQKTSSPAQIKLSYAPVVDTTPSQTASVKLTAHAPCPTTKEAVPCAATPEPRGIPHIPMSIETEIFFQRGQELLTHLNAPSLQTKPLIKAESSNIIGALDPAQFYVKHALLHILPYQKTLYKKYAKLRLQRAERVEKQPSLQVTIHKDGSLSNIFLKQSSGSPTFDKFYMQALKQASPLPKIPEYLNLPAVILEL